ncbi:MAG: transposase [Mycoplasma sp.]|nr:transposase [Mycoplasma sp.]
MKNQTKLNKHYSQEDKLKILWNLKKPHPWLYKAPTKIKVKYVNNFQHFFPIKILLRFVGLPPSTWGKYKNFDYNKKELEEQKCIDAIYKVFEENRKQIGAKRISRKLKEKNIIINHKKVARIMREQNIRSPLSRKMMKKSAITKRIKLNKLNN